MGGVSRRGKGKMMARCLSGPRAQNSSQKRSHVLFMLMLLCREKVVTLQILMYLMNAAFRSRL